MEWKQTSFFHNSGSSQARAPKFYQVIQSYQRSKSAKFQIFFQMYMVSAPILTFDLKWPLEAEGGQKQQLHSSQKSFSIKSCQLGGLILQFNHVLIANILIFLQLNFFSRTHLVSRAVGST